MFGTTYYDNVMSVLVLSGLAILVLNRETLRAGSSGTGGSDCRPLPASHRLAMGLKLPEMPFCVGFAAALLALGGSCKHQAARLAGRRHRRDCRLSLFMRLVWMVHIKHLTGNPLFPYFNDYWRSPLALAASYRDMRFVPTHFWRALFFPILFSLDWQVADDLGFQDIRVCVAYVLVIAAILIWLVRRESRDPLLDKRVTPHSVRLCGARLFRLAKMLRHLPLHHPAGDAGAASDRRRGGAVSPAAPRAVT